MALDQQTLHKTKIRLTPEVKQSVRDMIGDRTRKEFGDEKGIPEGTIDSILNLFETTSYENYVRIFGEPPPPELQITVDGTFFRRMVRYFQHLRKCELKDIYQELSASGEFSPRRVQTAFNEPSFPINKRLESIVRDKLIAKDIPELELESRIEEFERDNVDLNKTYTFVEIQPILEYIQKHSGIGARIILGSHTSYFKSTGRIPGRRYKSAVDLKNRIQTAVESGSEEDLEKIRSEVYGREPKNSVPYPRAKLMLDYLESKGESMHKLLGVTRDRYESLANQSPELKTISRNRYEIIVALVNQHLADRFAKLSTARSVESLELYLKDPNFRSRYSDVASEALGKMDTPGLRATKKKIEYRTADEPYNGKIVFVVGQEEFGVVESVNKQIVTGAIKSREENDIKEGYVMIRFFPSGQVKQYYFGTIKKMDYGSNR